MSIPTLSARRFVALLAIAIGGRASALGMTLSLWRAPTARLIGHADCRHRGRRRYRSLAALVAKRSEHP